MSAQSAKKKRVGSRRRAVNQNQTFEPDELQHATPEENTESLNVLANPADSLPGVQNQPSPENRRKFGSSRKHKGRQHVQESATESYHKAIEEVEESIGVSETPITTQMSTIQPQLQEELNQGSDYVASATHNTPLSPDLTGSIPIGDNVLADQDGNSANDGVCETDKSDALPSEKREDAQNGNLNNNYSQSESQVASLLPISIIPEMTTELICSPGEDTEFEQAQLSSAAEELTKDGGGSVILNSTEEEQVSPKQIHKISHSPEGVTHDGTEDSEVISVTETESKGGDTEDLKQDESRLKVTDVETSLTPEISTEKHSATDDREPECCVEQTVVLTPHAEFLSNEEQSEIFILPEMKDAHCLDDSVSSAKEQEFKPTDMHLSVMRDDTENPETISRGQRDEAEVSSAYDSELNVKIFDSKDSDPDNKQDEPLSEEKNFETVWYISDENSEMSCTDPQGADPGLGQVHEGDSLADYLKPSEHTIQQEKEGEIFDTAQTVDYQVTEDAHVDTGSPSSLIMDKEVNTQPRERDREEGDDGNLQDNVLLDQSHLESEESRKKPSEHTVQQEKDGNVFETEGESSLQTTQRDAPFESQPLDSAVRVENAIILETHDNSLSSAITPDNSSEIQNLTTTQNPEANLETFSSKLENHQEDEKREQDEVDSSKEISDKSSADGATWEEVDNSGSHQGPGDDVQHSEKVVHQEQEGILVEMEESELSLQSTLNESDASLGSQPLDSSVKVEEQTHTGFSTTGNRRKLGSSRRYKGRQQVQGHAAESNPEYKESPSNDESLETTQTEKTSVEDVYQEIEQDSVMSEPHDNPFSLAKMPDDSCEVLKSTVPQNPEANLETLSFKLENREVDEEQEQEVDSKEEASDKSLAEGATQKELNNSGSFPGTEDDISHSERTVHEEQEGILMEMEESESSSQAIINESDALLGSQLLDTSVKVEEQTHTGFRTTGSRRKLGTSRRYKGRQQVQESAAESNPENEESTRDDETLETTQIENSVEDPSEGSEQDSIMTEAHVNTSSSDVLSLTTTQNPGANPDSFTSQLENREEDEKREQEKVDTKEEVSVKSLAVEEMDNSGSLHSAEDDRSHSQKTVHWKEEEILFEMDSESSLQTMLMEWDTLLDSDSLDSSVKVEEQTQKGFSTTRNRRKLGSSRRYKGQQQVQESSAESNPEHEESTKEDEVLEMTQTDSKNVEDLSQGCEQDSLLSHMIETHDVSFSSVKMPDHSPEEQNLTTMQNPKVNLGTSISELDMFKEDEEKEVDYTEEASVKSLSVGATKEEMDNSSSLQGPEDDVRLSDQMVQVASQEDEGIFFEMEDSESTLQTTLMEWNTLLDFQPLGSSVRVEEQTHTDFSPNHDATDIMSSTLIDEAEVSCTYEPELDVNISDGFTADPEDSNPNNKQGELPSNENCFEASRHTNEDDHEEDTNVSVINYPQGADSGLDQVHEGDSLADIKPSEHTIQQEKEVNIFETEGETSLQNTQTDALLDSQPLDSSEKVEEQAHKGLSATGHRRKLGSSRKYKGKHHAKDSVDDNTRDNEPTDLTKFPLQLEIAVQEESVETTSEVLGASDTAQTVDYQVTEDAHVDTGSLSSLIMDKEVNTQPRERDREEGVDGNLQDNLLLDQSHLESEERREKELSLLSEIITEKHSAGEHTDSVEQERFSASKDLSPSSGADEEQVNISQVRASLQSGEVVNEVLEEVCKTTQLQDQLDVPTVVEHESSLHTLQSEMPHTHTGFSSSGHRRKMGSSRRNKGRERVKDPATEIDQTVNETSTATCEENTEKKPEEDTVLVPPVADNSAIVTEDISSSPDKDVDVCDLEKQNLLYHSDVVTSDNLFQLGETIASSCAENLVGLEINMQQSVDVMKTEVDVSVKNDFTEMDSLLNSFEPNIVGEDFEHHKAQEINDPQVISQAEMQEHIDSGDKENSQGRSRQKRRKMGSTRRTPLNRKPEEDIDSEDETKESNFDERTSEKKTAKSDEHEVKKLDGANIIHDHAETPVVTDFEIPNSVVRGGAGEELKDTSTSELSNIAEGAHGTNLEMDGSPTFHSVNRRRKMGSTRRALRSRGKGEDVDNVVTEAAENVISEQEELSPGKEDRDDDSERRKGMVFDAEELGEALLNPPNLQTLEENLSSLVQPVATECEPTPVIFPEIASASPKPEVVPEAAGGRRRKLGSNRRTRANVRNETSTEDKVADAEHGHDMDTIETTGGESSSQDQISEVIPNDKKPPADVSTSGSGEQPGASSEKKPVPKSPPPAEVNLSLESHNTLSLAGSSSGANSYNVVMIGDSSVGKTSFMKRAQSGKFSLDLPSSIGLDSCMWTVVVDGKPVVLKLWDTAGQERFHSITRQIFHRAHAFLLMYDITSAQSFTAVSYWANCIQEGAGGNVHILLLGNKSDSEKRQVETAAGESLAKEYKFGFLECSAATGENVIQSLETVARMLSQNVDTREETTVLHKELKRNKSSGCC